MELCKVDLFDNDMLLSEIHFAVNDVVMELDIVDVGNVIIPLWVRIRAMRCSPRSICVSFCPRVMTKFSFKRLWSETNVVPCKSGTNNESGRLIVIAFPLSNLVCI